MDDHGKEATTGMLSATFVHADEKLKHTTLFITLFQMEYSLQVDQKILFGYKFQ